MDQKTRTAVLCAMLGNVIFGFSFMFSRIALNITTPFVMLMYRFITTFVLLLLLAAWSGRHIRPTSGNIHWLRFDLKGKPLLPLLALGAVQPVGYFFCETYGIDLTNATVSGVIIALIPIVGIAFGALLLKEKPSLRQILFSLASIAAVAWLTLLQSSGGTVHWLGILWLLGAVVTGVLFNVMSRSMADRYSVLERTVVMMGVAAAVFTVLAIVTNIKDLSALLIPLHHPVFLLSIGYLSVCSSVIAFMALNFANNRLTIARTTAFANLTTVISLFAGAVFLHEPFSLQTLIASVIIVFSIWQVQRN